MIFFKNINKNKFARNVLLLTGGTAVAQVLNALLSPVITRMYSPEHFGILTLYSSILGILAIIGTLKYELAIPIADDDVKASNLAILSIIILLGYVLLITLFLIYIGNSVLGIFNSKELIKYKLLIPLGIFLLGMYSVLSQWAYRKKDYKALTKTTVTQSITQNVIKIGLGAVKFGPIGLVLGQIFAQSSGILTLAKPIVINQKDLSKELSFERIRWCARRYIRFPLYTSTSQFLNTLGSQLPVLFITSLYGSKIVGFFGFATMIVNMPVNLVGNSVGSVFYGEAAAIGRNDPERLRVLSLKLLKKLIIVGLAPILPIVLFGPFLFSVVFSVDWYQAGIYSRIISLLVYSRFIFNPISRVYEVFERQKDAFFIDITRVLLVLTAFGIAKYKLLSPYWAVGLYSIVMTIIYFLTFVFGYRIIKKEIRRTKGSIYKK